MKATRRGFLRLITAGAVATTTRPAFAAPRKIIVASLFGEDKPETKIWVSISELIERRLPGRFSFRIVKNAALGGEKDVAEGVRLGSIHGSLSTVTALSGWVPQAQLLDLPFLFRDADHINRVLAGPIGQTLRKSFFEQGFVTPAYINYGARHLLAKRELLRPRDLVGVRIRVIQSPLHAALWRNYGANPVAISIPETYNALKMGVVDAMDLTQSAYTGFKLFEVVPCLIKTSHIWASGVVYFSKQFWDSLTDEERDVFVEAARMGAQEFNRLIDEDEKLSIETAKKAGAWVVKPQTPEAWEAGASKVWQEFSPVVGGMSQIEDIKKL